MFCSFVVFRCLSTNLITMQAVLLIQINAIIRAPVKFVRGKGSQKSFVYVYNYKTTI